MVASLRPLKNSAKRASRRIVQREYGDSGRRRALLRITRIDDDLIAVYITRALITQRRQSDGAAVQIEGRNSAHRQPARAERGVFFQLQRAVDVDSRRVRNVGAAGIGV